MDVLDNLLEEFASQEIDFVLSGIDTRYATKDKILKEVQRLILAEHEACKAMCLVVCNQQVTGANDSYIDGRLMGATVCMNQIAARYK